MDRPYRMTPRIVKIIIEGSVERKKHKKITEKKLRLEQYSKLKKRPKMRLVVANEKKIR